MLGIFFASPTFALTQTLTQTSGMGWNYYYPDTATLCAFTSSTETLYMNSSSTSPTPPSAMYPTMQDTNGSSWNSSGNFTATTVTDWYSFLYTCPGSGYVYILPGGSNYNAGATIIITDVDPTASTSTATSTLIDWPQGDFFMIFLSFLTGLGLILGLRYSYKH